MIAFRQIPHWRVLRPTHSMALLLALVVSLPAVGAFAAAASDRAKLWVICRNSSTFSFDVGAGKRPFSHAGLIAQPLAARH